MFCKLSGDFRLSPKIKIIVLKQNLSQSASRPAWGFIYLNLCATVLVLLQTCLSLGGSVAVACGVRLSCSVFTVYSVLLSVSLVARALSIALRLQVYKRREHHDM